MNDRWLSAAEICVYLGIKRETIYKRSKINSEMRILISILLIAGLFAQVEIKYEVSKTDFSNGGFVKFIHQGKEILNLECIEWNCAIFSANSYELVYRQWDGAIEENENLKRIDFENLEDIKAPSIKLPNYDYNVVGFVLAGWGMTGHGGQSFYLINMDTGQWTVIYSGDSLGPKWFKENEKFGYTQEEAVYLGPPNFPIGSDYTYVINSINLFDKKKFTFYKDDDSTNLIYNNELSKITLTDSVLEFLKYKTIQEIDESFTPPLDDNYDETLESFKEQSLKTFIKYIYYSKKLNKHTELEDNIYPLLDPTLLDELKYIVYHEEELKVVPADYFIGMTLEEFIKRNKDYGTIKGAIPKNRYVKECYWMEECDDYNYYQFINDTLRTVNPLYE